MSKILSRQVTLTTAGVVYQLGTANVNETVMIKALTTNAGVVYIGNNGSNTVTTATGFPLASGDVAIIDVGDLESLYAVGTDSGDKVAILTGSA